MILLKADGNSPRVCSERVQSECNVEAKTHVNVTKSYLLWVNWDEDIFKVIFCFTLKVKLTFNPRLHDTV